MWRKPFAAGPGRQQHQVDLKDGVAMWETRDDIILTLRVQVHPVLLHNGVILTQGIAQHLGSVCEGGVGRQLDGGELIAGWVYGTDRHLWTDRHQGWLITGQPGSIHAHSHTKHSELDCSRP